MTTSATDSARMVTELVRLHQVLRDVALPLDLEGVAAQRQALDETVKQLEDYVIPRMMTVDAPLLAVVGGSTGAGKSTLVNSLVGHRVTESGLLRPTTRSAVLVHHPEDAQWFGQDRLLPGLARVERETNDPNALQLVTSESVPRGLALLDAPDVDSVEEANRTVAAELLAAADLWLWVTSAARYADQVPWEFLKAAADRSTAVAIVLDRTPDDAVQTVATHLARMLASRGLRDSPLFVVYEGKVSDDGVLPADHVAEIRQWLDALAADPDARRGVVAQTLDGSVRTLTFRVYSIADAAALQHEALETLRAGATETYAAAVRSAEAELVAGSAFRGEVAVRWQEVEESGLFDPEAKGGRRLFGKGRGDVRLDRVPAAVAAALELLVLEQAEKAADAAVSAWRVTPGGAVLAAGPDLGRASRGLRGQASRAVADWQQDVSDRVRAATAVQEGIDLALMVAVLAGGSNEGRGAHDALTAAFGVAGAGEHVDWARSALLGRFASLLRSEETRFTTLADHASVSDDLPSQLRQAVRRVDDIRYAAQRNDPLTGDAVGEF